MSGVKAKIGTYTNHIKANVKSNWLLDGLENVLATTASYNYLNAEDVAASLQYHCPMLL